MEKMILSKQCIKIRPDTNLKTIKIVIQEQNVAKDNAAKSFDVPAIKPPITQMIRHNYFQIKFQISAKSFVPSAMRNRWRFFNMVSGIFLHRHGKLLPIGTHLMRVDKHSAQSHLCHPVSPQTIKSCFMDSKVIDHHVIIQSNPAADGGLWCGRDRLKINQDKRHQLPRDLRCGCHLRIKDDRLRYFRFSMVL